MELQLIQSESRAYHTAVVLSSLRRLSNGGGEWQTYDIDRVLWDVGLAA